MNEQRRDPEATKSRLIAAGRDQFARLGFAGARTQAIADQADVNKAMIHYYYGDKQGLYSAVLLDEISAVQSLLAAGVPRTGSALERLEAFIDVFGAAMDERPAMPFLLVREQMEGAEHMEPAVRQELFGFLSLVREILVEGMESRDIRPVSPHHTHLALIGSLVFFLLTAPARAAFASRVDLPETDIDWREHVRQVRNLFLRGLATSPSLSQTNPSQETDS